MNEDPFKNQEEEDMFLEHILLSGFKMFAVRKSSDLPKNKPAFLLLTQNEKLLKELKKLAYDIDVTWLTIKVSGNHRCLSFIKYY